VPGELPDGLAIVGVPARADPRDALCGASSLSALPEGARVGTGSLRRRSQLLARRPDLRVEGLRGNVDTRLRKLEEEGFDAMVLAVAGLARLGRADAGAPLGPEELLPAPGQGALALEARTGDDHARALAAAVTDREALVRLTAERAAMAGLDASCHTPVAALAEKRGDELRLAVFAGTPDGSAWVRDELTGEARAPADVGARAAERMLAAGAGEVLAAT
jgi:hydroxymethylbilane synthase